MFFPVFLAHVIAFGQAGDCAAFQRRSCRSSCHSCKEQKKNSERSRSYLRGQQGNCGPSNKRKSKCRGLWFDLSPLDDSEEQSILNYIDSSTALGFPARFDMIREKVMRLLRLRVESSASLGINWTKRFLDRYSDYRSRFPRHLDQERHWNTDRKVFEDWFSLVRRTMDKYGIATGDVYNMDEKGHLMGVAGNIR